MIIIVEVGKDGVVFFVDISENGCKNFFNLFIGSINNNGGIIIVIWRRDV